MRARAAGIAGRPSRSRARSDTRRGLRRRRIRSARPAPPSRSSASRRVRGRSHRPRRRRRCRQCRRRRRCADRLMSLRLSSAASALRHGGATEIGDMPGEARDRVEKQRGVLGVLRQRPVNLSGIPEQMQRTAWGQSRRRRGCRRCRRTRREYGSSSRNQCPARSAACGRATAAAEPPDEPAGLSAGFHGFRVGPNSALLVLAPVANSGVLVLASTMAPAALSRRTASASSAGT